MSMDLFLNCVRDGESSTFTRALFEEVMGRGAAGPKSPLRDVAYADGGCFEIDGGEDEAISSLCFRRFGGETFFDRLWELADRSDSYLMWPGEPSIAVTRPDVVGKLDPSMVKELGPVVVARSGKELAAAIEEGFDPEGDEAFDDE